MHRRSFLLGVAGAGVAGAAGAAATGTLGGDVLPDAIHAHLDDDPLVQYVHLNGAIDRLEWTTAGTLAIYFGDGLGDAWSIHHRDAEPTVLDTLAHGGAPSGVGPVEMDFQRVLENADRTFPSREFQIVIWNADRSDTEGLVTGSAFTVQSTVNFEVPEQSGVTVPGIE